MIRGRESIREMIVRKTVLGKGRKRTLGNIEEVTNENKREVKIMIEIVRIRTGASILCTSLPNITGNVFNFVQMS